MIQIETNPVKCYNETEKLELAYVMFQTLANEAYRMQLSSQRFNRYKAVKAKYFSKAVNRADKKKAQKLVDAEMKIYDKEVKKFVKSTNQMCDSVIEQMPNKVYDLMDIGTEFMDKFLIVKS